MVITLGVSLYFMFRPKPADPAATPTTQNQDPSDPYGGVANTDIEPNFPSTKYSRTAYLKIPDGGQLTLPPAAAIEEAWYGADQQNGNGLTWASPMTYLQSLVSATAAVQLTVSPTSLKVNPNPGEPGTLKLRFFYNV